MTVFVRPPRSLLPVVTACVAVALTGCREDTLVVSVQADGRGTVRLERVLSSATSRYYLRDEEDEPRDAGRAQELAVLTQLSSWEGISAWTDVDTTLVPAPEGSRIKLVATGWFEDLARVREAKGDGAQWSLAIEADGLVVRRTGGLEASPPDSPLAMDDAAYDVLRLAYRRYLEDTSEQRGLSVELNLPSALTTVAGARQTSPSQALLELSSKEYLGLLQRCETLLADLRPRVISRELRRTAAQRQLEQAIQALGTIEARCQLPEAEASAAAAKAFDQRLAAAKTAWKASRWFGLVTLMGGTADVETQQTAQATAAARIERLGEVRLAGNETEAIATLRALVVAQQAFRETDADRDGERLYAAGLTALARAGVLNEARAGAERAGYRFVVQRSAQDPDFVWLASASPLEPDQSGQRWFVVDHGGVVYARQRAFQLEPGGKVPPDARPVR